jgi:single-strand DNA-binding protein
MPSFNKVLIIGNLTRDVQLKHLPGGTAVAEFGLAMNRKYRTAAGEDREDVCFVDCEAFGKQADTIAQWCRKGKPLFVEGRLKWDSWEDKQGGGKRSKLTVTVENFQFLGTRDDREGGEAERPAPSERPAVAGSIGRGAQPFGGDKEFDPGDIPFTWEGRDGTFV